ncbi:MAG: hypothetical protein B7Z68_00740 [Acidobacteria bacterium 21-70-11]|nr:MAG: hypothetical protein B7Z68_00740 [Acidobacteria bacterium 21-70-11]
MQDARIAANMVLSDWANEQPNLWTVQEQIIPCVLNQGQYAVNPTTILILDAFLRQNAGQPNQFDFYMYPISRTEWAAFPDKTTPGQPTVFWFDRLDSPTVTIWQPPNNATWEFHFYSVNQFQDADLGNSGTLQLPYYFLKAFADRLSAELAVMYAPDRAMPLMNLAKESWQKASDRNAETVPWQITPGLSGYYRIGGR